jgi:hypothetical protein
MYAINNLQSMQLADGKEQETYGVPQNLGFDIGCMMVQLFNTKKCKRKRLLLFIITVHNPRKKGLDRVGNLKGRDSPAHLPLTILKLNRKSHDFNLDILKTES